VARKISRTTKLAMTIPIEQAAMNLAVSLGAAIGFERPELRVAGDDWDRRLGLARDHRYRTLIFAQAAERQSVGTIVFSTEGRPLRSPIYRFDVTLKTRAAAGSKPSQET
jgi:hypothetical protein